jgi:predicted double-glycine peptidase
LWPARKVRLDDETWKQIRMKLAADDENWQGVMETLARDWLAGKIIIDRSK